MIIDNIEPIVFTGMNVLNNRVIGSFVERRFEERSNRYLYAIISDKTYVDYIHRNIHYREVLNQAKLLFIIDKPFDPQTEIRASQIEYNDIPDEYLPLDTALCPKEFYEPVYEYQLKLEGGLARNYKARIKDITKIQDQFDKLIKTFNPEHLNIKSEAYSKIPKAGSYGMNFEIKASVDNTINIFLREKDYMSFLYAYLDYCTNYLVRDVSMFKGDDTKNYSRFNHLVTQLQELYSQLKVVPLNFEEILKREIKNTALIIEAITEDIGENYSTIGFNRVYDDTVKPVCVFDDKYKYSIEETNKTIEEYSPGFEKDDKDVQYKILIYSLNTVSRTGSAYIQIGGEKDKTPKVRFKILGEEDIHKSRYTDSMHSDIWIDIHGRATRIDSLIKRLEIKFEK
ncbi:hypothetical protein ACFL6I_17430 [candidate division KSB1 bacterium]